eukprot:SAG31_NODE_3298_length_4446_cov_24.869335_5_plen_215_part_01
MAAGHARARPHPDQLIIIRMDACLPCHIGMLRMLMTCATRAPRAWGQQRGGAAARGGSSAQGQLIREMSLTRAQAAKQADAPPLPTFRGVGPFWPPEREGDQRRAGTTVSFPSEQPPRRDARWFWFGRRPAFKAGCAWVAAGSDLLGPEELTAAAAAAAAAPTLKPLLPTTEALRSEAEQFASSDLGRVAAIREMLPPGNCKYGCGCLWARSMLG